MQLYRNYIICYIKRTLIGGDKMENIIKIHLKDRDAYKNDYNEQIISYDLSNYILEELKGINIKQKVKFIITSDFEMLEQEKEDLVDMIRKNFGSDISEIGNTAKKHRMSNYLILFIGIVFILLYSLLKIEVLSEFILIFGWVFIGEAICNFLYEGIENRYHIMRRKQIVNAKILFE